MLLINYMMEEYMFAYVECSPVKQAASWFSVRKIVTQKVESRSRKRKEKKESDTWMD